MAGSWFSQPITQMVKPLVKPFQGAPFRLAMVFVGLALLVGFLVELVYPPQGDLAAAQADLCEMLTYAMTRGGVDKKASIIAAKSRIEARAPEPISDSSRTKPARAANEQGLEALRKGRGAEAVHEFQNAYNANPTDPEIVENLGVAYWGQGDLQRAARYVLQALLLEPGRYTAWLSLGRVYAAQGHLREAVGCFAHAYRFGKAKAREALVRDRGNHKLGKAASQALALPMMQEDSK